jgi:hypothetical protein
MLDDLTLLLSHVLFYHLLWLVENWVEEQIPSNLALEAWIGLKQVVHCHLLDFPVAVGQSGVGPLLGLMEPLGWVGFPD